MRIFPFVYENPLLSAECMHLWPPTRGGSVPELAHRHISRDVRWAGEKVPSRIDKSLLLLQHCTKVKLQTIFFICAHRDVALF